MSQAGIINIAGGGGGGSPIMTITGNDGVPTPPTANNVNIVGQTVANATNAIPVYVKHTAVSTDTIQVQVGEAAASSSINNAGLASFSNASFSVDANGFVSLLGGGEAIDSIALQTGTSPIVPTAAGLVTINGAVVAAGTNPVRSDGTGANTAAIEVQISQAIAATDATKIGLSNFDSAAFDVDANGFVQLNGGGIAATSFPVQANTAPGTNPVVPSAAGAVTINGAAVANHSVVLETRSRAANAYNLEVQYATSAASTDATKSGVAHFNSAQFSVDANGFVSTINAAFAWNDVSGAFSPLAENGYFITGTATGTLPASPTQGNTIKFFVDHASQLLTIQAAGSQIIRMANQVSSAGGTAVSTLQGDSCELVYRSANTCWEAVCGFSGVWNLS